MWKIPFASDCAKKSLENAKLLLENVAITDATTLKQFSAQGDALVVCAPVYESDLPEPFIELLKSAQLDFTKAALVLTYGKVTIGNAVYHAKKVFAQKHMPLMCAVAIPTNHCFVVSKSTNAPIKQIKKFANVMIATKKMPKSIEKIKKRKNIFEMRIKKSHSKFFPKPEKNIEKCVSCQICKNACPSQNKCIRCLACVRQCPQNAITFKIHPFPKIGLTFSTIIWRRTKFWK